MSQNLITHINGLFSSPTDTDDAGDSDSSSGTIDCRDLRIWQALPDSILLHVFSFLDVASLGQAACVCQVMVITFSFFMNILLSCIIYLYLFIITIIYAYMFSTCMR